MTKLKSSAVAGNAKEVEVKDVEQPINEVSQEEVKRALKMLLTKHDSMLATFYSKFDEYNDEYFGGQLSTPLITVAKLSNKTLGNYQPGRNHLQIENHIQLNRNFVALNTEERVLETLRHEMIHQWQDEIAYAQKGVLDDFKTYQKATLTEDGEIVYVEATQKKRPKDWHNKDFKEMAAVVGIPANGPKCTGNPADMPEPQSYNRKFRCGCVASNGHPLTIWSTRAIVATCGICGENFVEVGKIDKNAKTIGVNASHVELPGQDAVKESMKDKYKYFERFADKTDKDEFVARLVEHLDVNDEEELAQGVYQKGHNGYKEGKRYWVAYTADAKVSVPKKIRDKVVTADEPAASQEPPKEKELPKRTTTKKQKAEPEQEKELPKSKEVEKPAEPTVEPPAPEGYDINKPEDLIRAYKETGSGHKAAKLFGVNQSTFARRATKYGIDFSEV